MSLFKRSNCWHYRFSWSGRQYRGSCKTLRKAEAEKVEALVLARLEENKPALGSKKKIPILAEFAEQFFSWLESLPTDRPPTEATKRYYRIGWRLLGKTKLAGMRIDQITTDDVRETQVGSSPANTNNALRTLRRMLNRAKKQKNKLIAEVPVIGLVEEQSREMDLQPWMEERQ